MNPQEGITDFNVSQNCRAMSSLLTHGIDAYNLYQGKNFYLGRIYFKYFLKKYKYDINN